MRVIQTTVVAVVVLGLSCSSLLAQRGEGDQQGVARKAAKPKIASLSGEVLQLKVEPCRMTTGRSSLGTHLAISTPEGKTVTIHLGPAAEVEPLTKDLSRGMAIKAEVFRTEATPDGQYVARTLTFGDRTVVLRDRSLRPVWAGQEPSGKPPLKIAVTAAGPTLDADVDPQFGRCLYFVVIDPKTGSFEALKNTFTQGRQAGVQSAQMIASKGAKVLLTGKCGPSALRALSAERVKVVSNCSGTVREVVAQYKAGKLPAANEGDARSPQPSQDTPQP